MGLYSLPRSRILECHATLGETLRDIPKNGCEGDYWALVFFFVALVAVYAPLYVGRGG